MIKNQIIHFLLSKIKNIQALIINPKKAFIIFLNNLALLEYP